VRRVGRNLLGEGAAEHEGRHTIPGREAAPCWRLANDAGHLEAGDERQRRLQLVQASRDQHVGEAHAGGVHLDQRRASVITAGARSRYLFQGEAVGPRELGQDERAHEEDPIYPDRPGS
jgi:hypothetical protein